MAAHRLVENTKKTGMAATTERAAPAKRRRKQGPLAVIATSILLFAVVGVLLAQRVAAGADPVLGPVRRVQAPRPVIERRIVRRVIVETIVSSHARGGGVSSYSSSPVLTSQSSSGAAVPAPVTRSS